ncbi:MAG: hypothetical protein HUU50_03210 [Candidatus Brocadiae bacterium]|nr:hypothetical protein [Candidatus Brocadiia bacterium]
MDYFWQIITWAHFFGYIIGLAVVANWPFESGKKNIVRFFALHILCNIATPIAQKINLIEKLDKVMPFLHSFYIILNLLSFTAMIFLILGLIELGKKESTPQKDWENF